MGSSCSITSSDEFWIVFPCEPPRIFELAETDAKGKFKTLARKPRHFTAREFRDHTVYVYGRAFRPVQEVLPHRQPDLAREVDRILKSLHKKASRRIQENMANRPREPDSVHSANNGSSRSLHETLTKQSTNLAQEGEGILHEYGASRHIHKNIANRPRETDSVQSVIIGSRSSKSPLAQEGRGIPVAARRSQAFRPVREIVTHQRPLVSSAKQKNWNETYENAMKLQKQTIYNTTASKHTNADPRRYVSDYLTERVDVRAPATLREERKLAMTARQHKEKLSTPRLRMEESRSQPTHWTEESDIATETSESDEADEEEVVACHWQRECSWSADTSKKREGRALYTPATYTAARKRSAPTRKMSCNSSDAESATILKKREESSGDVDDVLFVSEDSVKPTGRGMSGVVRDTFLRTGTKRSSRVHPSVATRMRDRGHACAQRDKSINLSKARTAPGNHAAHANSRVKDYSGVNMQSGLMGDLPRTSGLLPKRRLAKAARSDRPSPRLLPPLPGLLPPLSRPLPKTPKRLPKASRPLPSSPRPLPKTMRPLPPPPRPLPEMPRPLTPSSDKPLSPKAAVRRPCCCKSIVEFCSRISIRWTGGRFIRQLFKRRS